MIIIEDIERLKLYSVVIRVDMDENEKNDFPCACHSGQKRK